MACTFFFQYEKVKDLEYKVLHGVEDGLKVGSSSCYNFQVKMECSGADKTVSYQTLRNNHYANMPMQYTVIFHGWKNVNFQLQNYNIFSYFCSKH